MKTIDKEVEVYIFRDPRPDFDSILPKVPMIRPYSSFISEGGPRVLGGPVFDCRPKLQVQDLRVYNWVTSLSMLSETMSFLKGGIGIGACRCHASCLSRSR